MNEFQKRALAYNAYRALIKIAVAAEKASTQPSTTNTPAGESSTTNSAATSRELTTALTAASKSNVKPVPPTKLRNSLKRPMARNIPRGPRKKCC